MPIELTDEEKAEMCQAELLQRDAAYVSACSDFSARMSLRAAYMASLAAMTSAEVQAEHDLLVGP